MFHAQHAVRFPANLSGFSPRRGALIALASLGLALAGCASAPPPKPEPEPAPVQAPAPQPAPKKPAIKPQAPKRYVVKKGDTLWDISSMFLDDPWLWPEIWYVNPQIHNPHLIYPGDVITLFYVNGQAQLRVEHGGRVTQSTVPIVKLEPKVRVEPIEQAIPTIPYSAIKSFISQPRIVDEETLDSAPYVLETTHKRIMAGAGDRLYVRGFEDQKTTRFSVVRKGEKFVDPSSGKTLGYSAIYLGSGRITTWGDPSTLLVTTSNREILPGDRLLPDDEEILHDNFMPHSPEQKIRGQIIHVQDGVSQIGNYQVVALDRGAEDGLDVGSVLAIYQKGDTVNDPYSRKGGFFGGDEVTLPEQRAGLLMVFKTYRHVSYGLVMKLTREAHVLDIVRNP